ncbi:MAG: DNA adenine methylase [Polyangiales bacterium]
MGTPARVAQVERRAAPFVKWVGGKGRILAQLEPLLPKGVGRMRHVEPFVGGGALFFHRAPQRALLCDVNGALVEAYETIRDRVEDVIPHLRRLAGEHCKERYYEVRERYNTASKLSRPERVALFIYLNKTCFNGLHRVNRKGHFNVPAGRYKNPRIVDPGGLRAASEVLQSAELVHAGFDQILRWARPGDFVYFDPPYVPLSHTSNFTSYAQDGFGPEEQLRLRDVFRELDRRGCKLMLSNSDTDFVRDAYAKWNIDVVAAPRAVNCNGRGRGKITEIVVRNYG